MKGLIKIFYIVGVLAIVLAVFPGLLVVLGVLESGEYALDLKIFLIPIGAGIALIVLGSAMSKNLAQQNEVDELYRSLVDSNDASKILSYADNPKYQNERRFKLLFLTAYLNTSNFSKAISTLFEIQPSYKQINTVGTICLINRNYDGAMACFSKILETKDDYRNNFNMGFCHFSKSEFETAKNYFEKALSKSEVPEVLYNLAITNFHLGNKKEALKYYKRISPEKLSKESLVNDTLESIVNNAAWNIINKIPLNNVNGD